MHSGQHCCTFIIVFFSAALYLSFSFIYKKYIHVWIIMYVGGSPFIAAEGVFYIYTFSRPKPLTEAHVGTYLFDFKVFQ